MSQEEIRQLLSELDGRATQKEIVELAQKKTPIGHSRSILKNFFN